MTLFLAFIEAHPALFNGLVNGTITSIGTATLVAKLRGMIRKELRPVVREEVQIELAARGMPPASSPVVQLSTAAR